MAETKHRRRKVGTRDTWYLTYAEKIRECSRCGREISPGTEFFFRRNGFIVKCKDCGSGHQHEISNRLKDRRGDPADPAWTPNQWETSIMVALYGHYKTAKDLSTATHMHTGKVNGLLQHLLARKCVEKRGHDQWAMTSTGHKYLS